MLAIFQFGVAFAHYIDVTDAARAAARKAATKGADTAITDVVANAAARTQAEADGTAAAYNSLGCPDPTHCWASGMTVTPSYGNESGTGNWVAGNSVTMTVSVPLKISILGVTLPGPRTLRSSSTMRIERSGVTS
jgi:Flp pilus assembly protein TadG